MAMELLKNGEYMVRQYSDLDEYEEKFLRGLGKGESNLLRKAYALNEERNVQSGIKLLPAQEMTKNIEIFIPFVI